MIKELKQFLWVETELGDGQVLFLIDYGPHENLVFVVALKNSRLIKHFTTEQVKICRNYTFGIGKGEE